MVAPETPETARAVHDAEPASERPWPLGLVRTLALLLVLGFVAGVAGWAIAQGSDDERDLNRVDIGFLGDMAMHHNGAISLSFTYLAREHDPAVGHFARDIVVSQAGEITSMNGMLGTAGPSSGNGKVMGWMGDPVPLAEMPGMPTEVELARLRASNGPDADELFTRLMILHHAAGADMSDYAAEHGRDPEVTRFARSIANIQRREIAQMNSRRRVLGFSVVEIPTAHSGAPGHSH